MSTTGCPFRKCHFCADIIAPYLEAHAPELAKFSLTSGFFWIVIIATTLGLILSFTRARKLEGAGASRIGSILLYVLVATVGMQMDVTTIFNNPGLFMVGLIWMGIHIIVMFSVGKLIKAPFLFHCRREPGQYWRSCLCPHCGFCF